MVAEVRQGDGWAGPPLTTWTSGARATRAAGGSISDLRRPDPNSRILPSCVLYFHIREGLGLYFWWLTSGQKKHHGRLISASPVVRGPGTARQQDSTPHQLRHAPGLELACQSMLAVVIAACVPRQAYVRGPLGGAATDRRPTPNPCYSRAILSSASAQGATRDQRKKKRKFDCQKSPVPNPPSQCLFPHASETGRKPP